MRAALWVVKDFTDVHPARPDLEAPEPGRDRTSRPASAFSESSMNEFDDDIASEWLAEHWVFEAVATVGSIVYWRFVSKEDGFPWEDYYVEIAK